MSIEGALTQTELNPSLNETARIMDEIDRLLSEMKEMMSIIKRIMSEEIEGQAHIFFTED